jgi:hypothetical protein
LRTEVITVIVFNKLVMRPVLRDTTLETKPAMSIRMPAASTPRRLATVVLASAGLAAAVDPGLDEQPAASTTAARPALASTAVARRRGVRTAGMRIDIAGFVSRVVSRRTGRITGLLKTITVMASVRNSAGGG